MVKGKGAEGHRAIGVDDGSTQVRNIRDPGQPIASEYKRARDHTSTIQIVVQVLCDGKWCEFQHTGDQISQDGMDGECSLCRWVVVGSLVRRNLKIR